MLFENLSASCQQFFKIIDTYTRAMRPKSRSLLRKSSFGYQAINPLTHAHDTCLKIQGLCIRFNH